jgi:hypothetical protein
VAITEVNEGGAVPSLKVTNAGDHPVLLLDGEELIGAKQNRVLNTTVLVAAHATVVIPVSCVEQGRWSYRTRGFAASDASLFASVRRKKAASVTRSVREQRQHLSDQGEVWDEVASIAAAHGVQSPTGAMHDVYARYEADIGAARKALEALPGQVGAAVFLTGTWVGLECLAAPRLFAAAWPRLCAGYAADAIHMDAAREAGRTIDEVLAKLLATELEPAPPIGLGSEVRLSGGAVGAALVVDDRLAHLAAFPAMAER